MSNYLKKIEVMQSLDVNISALQEGAMFRADPLPM